MQNQNEFESELKCFHLQLKIGRQWVHSLRCVSASLLVGYSIQKDKQAQHVHGMAWEKLLCEVGCLTFVEISLSYKDTVSLSPGCCSVHSAGSYFLCSCSLLCVLSKYIFMITIRRLKWDFVMLVFIDCRCVFKFVVLFTVYIYSCIVRYVNVYLYFVVMLIV